MFGTATIAIALAAVSPGIGSTESVSAGSREKVICRSVAVTGTMVAREKLCRLASSWKRGTQGSTRAEHEFWEERLPTAELAPGQAIEVGEAKWDKLPALDTKPARLPYRQLVEAVGQILRKDECKLAGQSPKAFDIEIPYAVLMEPDGKVKRVVVGKTGCSELESLVGYTVLARAERGDFKPTGEGKARWFGDRINFTLQ